MTHLRRDIKKVVAYIYRNLQHKQTEEVVAPILCYHTVNERQNEESDPIHPDLFEAHICYLRENYNVITIQDIVNALTQGLKLPQKSVAVTFDDGYRDNYEVAFPILKKYQTPATFYVVTGFINNEIELNGAAGWEPMTWSQLLELDKSEIISIGAHTHTHSILSRLNAKLVDYEITTCLDILQAKLGHKIDSFAYPYGQRHHIHSGSLRILKSYGVSSALSTCWKTSHTLQDLYMLNRVMVCGTDSVRELELKISGAYDYINYIQLLKSQILSSYRK